MNNIKKTKSQMKTIISLAFAFLTCSLMAQQINYNVEGKIGTVKTQKKVYLQYRIDKKNVTDSSLIKNGAFSFKGKIDEPVKARLIIDHTGKGLIRSNMQDLKEIYLEQGAVAVNTPDSMYKATIKGGIVNTEAAKYNETVATIAAKFEALFKNNQSDMTKEQQQAIEKKYDEFKNEWNLTSKKFISENPDSYISLDVLKSNSGSVPDLNEIEPIFNSLSARIRQSKAGKEYAATIEKLRSTAIGATAPDFEQSTPDGKPVKLSDFKGKYVLLDFWASWCSPCRAENPNVVKAYNQYNEKGFTVLGVSLDNEKAKEAWIKAIEKDGLKWTNVSDLKGWQNAVAELYSVQAVPQNFLIDPQGKIIAKNLRGEELEAKLKEIFQ